MLKKWMALLIATLFTLCACTSRVYNQTETNAADVKIKTSEARQKSDRDAKTPSLVIKKGPYVDTSPINLDKDPYWLNNHIVIRGDQLPFSYYSRTIASGAGEHILTKYQPDMKITDNITVNYTGTIKGALDLLATKTASTYTIQHNTIYWQAFVTKTFEVAFMPGGTDYLMGQASGSGAAGGSSGGGGGGSGGGSGGGGGAITVSTADASGDEFSSLKATLSVWKDLEKSVTQMLSAEGKAIVSESTTSVTVRDRPANVQLIGQFIENLNHNLSKQVLVKVQVLEVNLQNDYNFGINWSILANAFHKSPFKLNADYGTPVSITTLSSGSTILPVGGVDQSVNPASRGGPGLIPSYTILISALNQQGKTSIVSEPRVVCLNNQVSVIRITDNKGYLASVQNTTLAGNSSGGTNNTVTSQLTPGMVTTGLTLYVLPKILGERIYLQVNADISNLIALDPQSAGTQSDANNTQIQTPHTTSKSFNQRSMIKSGDTLILSGFRQVSNQTGAMQFLNSQTLGGRGAKQNNTETVILITPIILHGSI
jgi:type IVB pilus formation R64 PilN family outer membrane protein